MKNKSMNKIETVKRQKKGGERLIYCINREEKRTFMLSLYICIILI